LLPSDYATASDLTYHMYVIMTEYNRYVRVSLSSTSHVRVFRALGHVHVAARRAWPCPPDVACGDAWAEDALEGVSIVDAGCVVDDWVDGAVAA